MKIKIVSLLLTLILVITLIPIQNIKAYENDIEELQALITEGESITDKTGTNAYVWVTRVKNYMTNHQDSYIYNHIISCCSNGKNDGINIFNYYEKILGDLKYLLNELLGTNNYSIDELITQGYNISNNLTSDLAFKWVTDVNYFINQYPDISVYNTLRSNCYNARNDGLNIFDYYEKILADLIILKDELPINKELQDIIIDIINKPLYIIENEDFNKNDIKVTATYLNTYSDNTTKTISENITNYKVIIKNSNTITISYTYNDITKEKDIELLIIPIIQNSDSLVVYANTSILKDAGIDPNDITNKKLSFWDFESSMSKVQRDVDSDGIDDYYGFGYNKNLETLIYSQFNTDSIKWQFEDIKMKYDISECIQTSAIQAWFDNKLCFLIDSAKLESFIKTTGISYTKITVNGLSTIEENKIEEPENTNIKVPSNIKIKKNNSKKITISYSKISNAKYEIQISTDKNLKKNVKTYNTKKNKVSIKNLKKTKTYYIRIRAIKTIDGKDYYSEWSDIKSIKMED